MFEAASVREASCCRCAAFLAEENEGKLNLAAGCGRKRLSRWVGEQQLSS